MNDYTSQKNGGFNAYPDRTRKKTFFRASDRYTKTVTIKSGQVLKAKSFVKSEGDGRCVAYSGFSESASVKFVDIAAGTTVILAGLTFTAGGSGATAAQLAESWADIESGTAFGDITGAVGGSFTAGTLTGYFTESTEEVDTILMNSATSLINATDIAATGTGAAPTITIVGGITTDDDIAGVTLFDVDASSGDVEAEVYTKASFWDEALVWSVNPAVDTVTLADGTTVACTTYNTGCDGDSVEAIRLKKKFVENSGFSELGFSNSNEV